MWCTRVDISELMASGVGGVPQPLSFRNECDRPLVNFENSLLSSSLRTPSHPRNQTLKGEKQPLKNQPLNGKNGSSCQPQQAKADAQSNLDQPCYEELYKTFSSMF
ncbi:hypothetical protein NDU88_006953 [Pleurodeles waltl]|uniref:Uncharacterized protein n=1 Tax=Pleurodeles waltl TaxID=8319 RepID=A0AAV7SRE4_PLEWA|nr:hypothetical protein NDU88_006953 [Pleurodeles waltl]